MTTRYAAGTDVPSSRSRDEIERTLTRYGATRFQYGWEEDGETMRAVIQFVKDNLVIRFLLTFPSREDPEFTLTPTGRDRSDAAMAAAYEQAVRSKWRALLLVVKAKLEAVETGITTFEQEFLPHVVLPGGHTVADEVLPQIEAILNGTNAARLQITGGAG